MIGAIVFLIVVSVGVFKMVYDHQIFKDINKIKLYGQENEEGTEEGISE